MATTNWALQYNDLLSSIPDDVKKFAYENSAKYIFVKDKEGRARCSRCNADLLLPHTKHLQKCICPNCETELQIQHVWRMSRHLEVIDFTVFPTVINATTLVLRYVMAYSMCDTERTVNEIGRMFINDTYTHPIFYVYRNNTWERNKAPYFLPHCGFNSYMDNKWFCMYAREYHTGDEFADFAGLKAFEYYPLNECYDSSCLISQMHYLMTTASLNEKLAHAGFNQMIKEHNHDYRTYGDRRWNNINYRATSLPTMLKLDHYKYRIFTHKPTYQIMSWLQKHNHLEADELVLANYDTVYWQSVHHSAAMIGVSYHTLCNYLHKYSINYNDYNHYLQTLQQMNYLVNHGQYVMPIDFASADKWITQQYKLHTKNIENQKVINRNIALKKIADGLRTMPQLQNYMNGNRGLFVYVPESTADFISEGTALNNCLRTYPERVAAGTTLIFYIRKLDDPTAPFIAMEYAHGQIMQIRYNHNIAVTDTQILNFATDFTNTLRDNHILVA